MSAKLVWITPDAEKLLVYMARVSNPGSQEKSQKPEKLIAYLIKHKHWSPFEMVSACVEINTTRDISRQILRHTSFRFQEFSQRYADTEALPPVPKREARLQDKTNRQASHENTDAELDQWWYDEQDKVLNLTTGIYKRAIARGIAKEQARVILPEGLTPTRMYMLGSIRSWIHYFSVRTGEDTQKEHREIAVEIKKILAAHMPITFQET